MGWQRGFMERLVQALEAKHLHIEAVRKSRLNDVGDIVVIAGEVEFDYAINHRGISEWTIARQSDDMICRVGACGVIEAAQEHPSNRRENTAPAACRKVPPKDRPRDRGSSLQRACRSVSARRDPLQLERQQGLPKNWFKTFPGKARRLHARLENGHHFHSTFGVTRAPDSCVKRQSENAPGIADGIVGLLPAIDALKEIRKLVHIHLVDFPSFRLGKASRQGAIFTKHLDASHCEIPINGAMRACYLAAAPVITLHKVEV